MRRRNYLAIAGSAAAVSVGGCLGGDESSPTADAETTEGDGSDSTPEATVASGPASGETFRLSGLDPVTTTVEEGTEFDVSVTVENLTESEQSGTVALLSDGINYSQDVTLGAGGSRTVTFAAVTSGTLGEGTHTLTISVGDVSVESRVTVESTEE